MTQSASDCEETMPERHPAADSLCELYGQDNFEPPRWRAVSVLSEFLKNFTCKRFRCQALVQQTKWPALVNKYQRLSSALGNSGSQLLVCLHHDSRTLGPCLSVGLYQ